MRSFCVRRPFIQMINFLKYSTKTPRKDGGVGDKSKVSEDQYFVRKNKEALRKIKQQLQAEINNNIIKKNRSEDQIQRMQAEMKELDLQDKKLDQKLNSDGPHKPNN